MKKLEFINFFIKHFKTSKYQLVFRMGEETNKKKRFQQVVDRFKEISEDIFMKKEVWIVLILWDVNRGTKEDLRRIGFDEDNAIQLFHGKNKDNLLESKLSKEDELLYLNYKKYSFMDINPLVSAIAGYELGLDCGANISAYFLSFQDTPIFINLYDDRGMELLCNDFQITDNIYKKYSEYILNKSW